MSNPINLLRRAVDNVTFRQYSFLQVIGWLIIGNIAGHSHPWWVITLYAVGILFGAAIINELIRISAGLPREKTAK